MELMESAEDLNLKNRVQLADIFANEDNYLNKKIVVAGWARTLRIQGGGKLAFVDLSDGTTFDSLQVVCDMELNGDRFSQLSTLGGTGASFLFVGKLVNSPGKGQSVELFATSIEVLGGINSQSYPLAKKKHSLEHLREYLHLRARTRIFGAVARIRNVLAFSVHKFFQSRNFVYCNTPILTSSDCEGAGEMFQVTTLLQGANDVPSRISTTPDGRINYSSDFFKRPTFLAVSGQLNVESYACALSNVYTFGPTFRAEKSKTTRHLAEFWMIEPEIAFADLSENIDLAESFLKYVLGRLMKKCPKDLEFCEKFELDALKELQSQEKTKSKGPTSSLCIGKKLRERIQDTIELPFERLTYTEAIKILQDSGFQFEVEPNWGIDLPFEMERYLTDYVFKKPVILSNYPKEIKAFYMRINDDGKTVAAMDILVPGIGELIGGSQREERLEILQERVAAFNLNPKDYDFYLDLRKYGSVPHSGFGLGFERLVRYATGMLNVKDTCMFPRAFNSPLED